MAYMNKMAVLRALANTVKRAGITNNVTIIAKAKVPIIKFVTIHGSLSVDISVNHINGVFAGKMIVELLKELPALRTLVLIIKAFLGQRSMNEVFSGGLGSYSIVCLAVSFLQMHPKIRRREIDPLKNLGVLMMEFFELYGCYFNYQEVGISIRDGGSYFSKARRGWQDSNRPHLLSIEDPNDMCTWRVVLRSPHSLIAWSCSERRIKGFLWDCEGANHVRGRFHNLDVHCVFTCWIDEFTKGRPIYKSQSTKGARGPEHSFEHPGYLTGGLSQSDSLTRLVTETSRRQ